MDLKLPVTITTDGACSCNPGPGGWAAILEQGARRKEVSGSAEATTNNRMALMAAIGGLTALKRPCAVTLRTDSQYLVTTLLQLEQLCANTWTRKHKPIPNADLVELLYGTIAAGEHTVTAAPVAGHAGDADNARADALAKAAIQR